MSRSEFETEVRRIFEDQGCQQITVSTKLFFNKADVFFRDSSGKRRHFIAEEQIKRGKSFIRYWDADAKDWIDEIEEISAILDD